MGQGKERPWLKQNELGPQRSNDVAAYDEPSCAGSAKRATHEREASQVLCPLFEAYDVALSETTLARLAFATGTICVRQAMKIDPTVVSCTTKP